jgi:hypothetical protein
MAHVHSFVLSGKIGVSLYHSHLSSYHYPSTTDTAVLNHRRNSPLVFDAAGKCILRIYSNEDMELNNHTALGRMASPKDKGKRSAKPVPMHAAKKRKVVSSDDEEEPLVHKKFSTRNPDQSLEGWLAFLSFLNQRSTEMFSLEIAMQLSPSDSE